MPVRDNRIERSDKTKSVEHLVPVDFFGAVGVVDGNGVKRNRLVFRFRGTKKFFMLFPEGTEENMRPASPWLQSLLEKEAGDGMSDIPEEKAVGVSTGSPL